MARTGTVRYFVCHHVGVGVRLKCLMTQNKKRNNDTSNNIDRLTRRACIMPLYTYPHMNTHTHIYIYIYIYIFTYMCVYICMCI